MILSLRMTDRMVANLRRDLRRPHPFAAERVGFLNCKAAFSPLGWVLIAYAYNAVADEHYKESRRFGALVSSDGFLPPLQTALSAPVSICHVHLHDHKGRVRFSHDDDVETHRFMPDFAKVRPSLPHCAIVVGEEQIWGRAWIGRTEPSRVIDEVQITGAPFALMRGEYDA